MSELKGICPKCGVRYFGWALADPSKQKCDKCGSDLEIAESGVRIRTSYSSFATRTYRVTSVQKRKYGSGSTIIN
jgi:transcription initiation factor IIE alpha subunit